MFADPGLELLIRLGLAHEEAYLRALTEAGLGISTIPPETSTDSAEHTGEARPLSTAKVGKISSEAKRTLWSEAAARTIEAMRVVTSSMNSIAVFALLRRIHFWQSRSSLKFAGFYSPTFLTLSSTELTERQ